MYKLHSQAHLLIEQKAFIIKITKLSQYMEKYNAGTLSSERINKVPEVFKLWAQTFKEFEAFREANKLQLETNF